MGGNIGENIGQKMGQNAVDASQPVDGRRARRQRSREAIVAAAFSHILEGKGTPSADDVAERAGVSVSSIFRNFDGLADIQQQALELFNERYAHLLHAIPPLGSRFEARTDFFLRTRLDLYEQASPLMALARVRAFEDDRWRERIASNRAALAAQLRACFAPEIDELTPADASDVVSVLDSFTSPEAFDLMTTTHARTRGQLDRSWRLAIHAVFADWPTTSTTTSTTTSRTDTQP